MVRYLAYGLPTVIAYDDSNLVGVDDWYILRLPNSETNVRDNTGRIAAFVSWGIALAEYLLQVPANRIGFRIFSLGQLKILQEAITLLVFVPFAVLFMKSRLTLDFLWASLCIVGAVFFAFRSGVSVT